MEEKSKTELISIFLKNNYNVNTPIFIQEVYDEFYDTSPNTIRTIFKRLSDDQAIERIDSGVYALPNPNSIFQKPTVYASDIIREKYIEKTNDIFGYYSGFSFSNSLNLTVQTASVEEIASNNSSNKKRSIEIKGRKIILNAPRVKITNNNYKLLQVLDLFNDFEKYSEYNLKDAKPKIVKYLKNIDLTSDEIESIVDKYPLKAQVNFYKSGVYYEITQR
jgi:hypothetical protein